MTSNLSAALEEREIFAADILDMNAGKDVIIKNACDKRDEAVEAKNQAEVELASNRIELMQVFKLSYIVGKTLLCTPSNTRMCVIPTSP